MAVPPMTVVQFENGPTKSASSPRPSRRETLSARERLIVALDVTTKEEAAKLVEELGDSVEFYKIGHELILGGDGIALARDLVAAGKQVFLDAKLLDIGNTVERSAANIAALGVTFLTVHGHDSKTMRAAVAGRGESALKLLSVTVMTNLTQDDLSEQGFEMKSDQLVAHRAKLAAGSGFDGVVTSAREAALVRQTVGRDFLIVTPGIRPAGADIGDQARVMTPARAIEAGATRLVVGRPITQADVPKAAAVAIIAEIDAALAAGVGAA